MFSHQRLNREGETGEAWKRREGKSRRSCHALSTDGRTPGKRVMMEEKEKELFFFPAVEVAPCLSRLAVWPVASLPFGLIKQTVGPTRSVGGGKSWWVYGGDLSSAGINLCDRGLLEESDHPCWLAGRREAAVWGDVAEGKVTASAALNFKGSNSNRNSFRWAPCDIRALPWQRSLPSRQTSSTSSLLGLLAKRQRLRTGRQIC